MKQKPSAKRQKKVLLAMSGGVDSSVAALLLKKQGYKVVGAFMRNYSETKNKLTGVCAWREERAMALKIAATLNIPLVTLNFEKEYARLVIDDMFKKYKEGITPNPDVDCNNKIKFPLLKKAAKKLGCELIATGHYARNIKSRGESAIELHRAKDESKDQSYFLYRLTQKDLQNTLFPIGNLTKKEVRALAKKHGFPNAEKKGTVGICFIGKINLKEFLKKRIQPKKGSILDPEDKIIGSHDGIFYYTINQRLGPRYGIELEKNPKEPMKKFYVAQKDKKTNTIIAAPEGHPLLLRKEIILTDEHWITQSPEKNKKHKLFARIRQVGELLPCVLFYKNANWHVTLDKKITGISEGQAIVLYNKTQCLGGGVITFL